jgi:recombination protein RecT
MTNKTIGSADAMRDLLRQIARRIPSVVPSHIRPEKMVRMIGAAVSSDPSYLQSTPDTFTAAVLRACQYGLDVGGPFPQAHLKLDWNQSLEAFEVYFQAGYRGLICLAYRTGQIQRVNAKAVYQSESSSGSFSYSTEPPDIRHVGKGRRGPADEVSFAYCVVETTGGARYQEVLDRDAIDKKRSLSSGDQNWHSHFPEMSWKAAVNELFYSGLIPMSVELLDQAAPRPAAIDCNHALVDPLGQLVDGLTFQEPPRPPAPASQPPPPEASVAKPQASGAVAEAAADRARRRRKDVEHLTDEVIYEINRLAGTRFKAVARQNRDLVATLVDQGYSLGEMLDVVTWAFVEWQRADAPKDPFVPPMVLRPGPFRESLAALGAAGAHQVAEGADGAHQVADGAAGAHQVAEGADGAHQVADGAAGPHQVAEGADDAAGAHQVADGADDAANTGIDLEPWMRVQDEIARLPGATEDQAQLIAIDLKLPGRWVDWTEGQAAAVVRELRGLAAQGEVGAAAGDEALEPASGQAGE